MRSTQTVESRDNPELADKPCIIGGGKRGVVRAACTSPRTLRRAAQPCDVQGAGAVPVRDR